MTMTVDGAVQLRLGQCHDVIATQKDKPWIRYYSVEGGNKMTLLWEKPLPEGVVYNCWKYTTPSRKIILSHANVMFVFTKDLTLLSKYTIPGAIRGVKGDDYFLMCNGFTEASRNSGELQISRRAMAEPEEDVLTLSIPAEGAYKRDDELHAACAGDGRTVIIARKQLFVDFYDPNGEPLLCYVMQLTYGHN